MAKNDNTLLAKAAPATTDAERVRNWRAQILRSLDLLKMKARMEAAESAMRLVYSDPSTLADYSEKLLTKGQIDLNYALPILEQSFARASLKVPAPTLCKNRPWRLWRARLD